MTYRSDLRFSLLGLAFVASAGATTLTYDDFSSVAGLQLNNDAGRVGNVLRLTPATTSQRGSAFSTSAITLASNVSFSTYFQFRITNSGGTADGDGVGADGIVFVLQTVSNTAGGSGGGIGYSGLANSVGVEFDTYNNLPQFGDPDGNHVGIDLAGSVLSVKTQLEPTRFNNGQIWNAWIDFNGATNLLEARWSLSAARPAAAQLSDTVNLASVLGSSTAFAGFTAGTGGGFGDQDILRWEFRDTFSPIDDSIPEPATFGLLAAGLLVIVARRATEQG